MTLERIEHKVFASEAPLDEMGQFGSALATTKLNTKDVAEIQALPAYTQGWGSAIISENNYPAMEEMNGVLNVMSYHTGYLYQEGIPTYSATQEYSVTSWVKDLAGEKVYKSLQGGNKGRDLTDPAWWMELKLGGGGGLEIGDIGFTQMAIDETKGKRRILNGQLIIQDQYVQFTNIIKQSVALNPDLACTETEWQTEVTMNTFGLCGKFVIDNEGGTIRLPKYPNYFVAGLANIAPVVGNGITLGLTNGINNVGISCSANGTLVSGEGIYNVPVASSGTLGTRPAGIWGVTTDPTKSGIEAQIDEKQIVGTYFIQIATGAETEDNIINEIELNNPFSLLDYKFSEYELNNLSWLRSNGQWNSKITHPAVYDLLLKIYNGVETKAGVSVKLHTEAYTDYDFRINTAEETFRLPIKVKLASGKAVVGNGMALGITDGTDNHTVGQDAVGSNADDYGLTASISALGSPVGSASAGYASDMNGVLVGITTDPNYSGLELSDSDLYLYFYVGETVQNANLINAGRIEEKLADYLSRGNKEEIISWCIPDFENEIAIANVANGFVYTTPTVGYLKLNRVNSDASAIVYLYKGTNTSGRLISGGLSTAYTMVNAGQFNTGPSFMLIMVGANEDYYFSSNNISRASLSFVPCKGVN